MHVQTNLKNCPSVKVIEKKLRKLAIDRLNSEWTSKKEKAAIKQATDSNYTSVAIQLHRIASLLYKHKKQYKRTIWAVCEKSPRNLDSGRHYYSVYYITKDGEMDKFWPYDLWGLFDMDSQDRDRQMYKYVFSSGAIGMSRLLDATDSLFSTIKKLTGAYAQIDVI